LELNVLVGREWAHPYLSNRVPGDARTDAHEHAQVHDRRIHRPVDGKLLDVVQQRLALPYVTLARLVTEHLVDVRVAAVGVGALGLHDLLDSARRVAGVSRPSHE